MNKLYWIKDNLFNLGVVLVVAAAVFVALFLGTEKLEQMSGLVSFAGGFLISGFISLFLGFVFSITFWYTLPEETETKSVNTNRIRAVLIAVIALYLILLGYLLIVDSEWEIRSLIIENVAGVPIEPSYAFYPPITLTSTSFFYAIIIIFGIFVLPVILAEFGFLDKLTEHDDSIDEQTLEHEESYDRFVEFLKKHFSAIPKLKNIKTHKKIRNYSLQIIAALTIAGICLIVLPPFLIKDGPLTPDPSTGTLFVKDYMGVARGTFLLLGILFIVFAIFLIRRFRKTNQTE